MHINYELIKHDIQRFLNILGFWNYTTNLCILENSLEISGLAWNFSFFPLKKMVKRERNNKKKFVYLDINNFLKRCNKLSIENLNLVSKIGT